MLGSVLLSTTHFLLIADSHSLNCEDVFRVLIENSTKENHPLNANFLHEVLINKDLSIRDYLWTTFVNHLDNDEERLFQLVKCFERRKFDYTFCQKNYQKTNSRKTVHVQVMLAHSKVLWEEEYDASQEEATAFDIPCQSLIKQLQLEQKQADGYYYTKDGTLACFDGRLTGKCGGFFMRMDLIKNPF